MKRTIAIFAALAILFSFCGCQGQETHMPDSTEKMTVEDTQQEVRTEAPSETQPDELQDPLEILSREGTILGQIEDGVCTAADAGILYSVLTPASQYTMTAQYRFFRTADQKDILLGTLEDQGYESFYARTELDGIIYALAVTGDPGEDDASTLWLLAFDPAAETMTKYVVSEDGLAYAAMSAANGRLLIMSHEMTEPKYAVIREFDPATGTFREVLTFTDKEDSLRGVYAEETGLYLLRLKVEDDSPRELVLDHYDREYRKISEQPLNDVMIPAALNVPGILDEAEVIGQFGMMVSSFAVVQGRYLFYENFSLIRMLIDLESGEALHVSDDVCSMIRGGAWGFFRLGFTVDETTEPEILLLRDGKLERMEFTPADSRSLITSVTCSPAGTWLIRASDSNATDPRADALIVWTDQ